MELMKDGADFLMFVSECLLSFISRVNNTFVDFVFMGAFSLGIETIYPLWVPNLSEAPLPVWIID